MLRNEGFHLVRGRLAPAQVAALRDRADARLSTSLGIEPSPGLEHGSAAGAVGAVGAVALAEPAFAELVSCHLAPGLLRSTMGADLVLLADQLVSQPRSTTTDLNWRQERPPEQLSIESSYAIYSIVVCLAGGGATGGRRCYLARSHQRAWSPVELAELGWPEGTVAVTLQPGDVVLGHHNVVVAVEANRTDEPQVIYQAWFVSARARYLGDPQARPPFLTACGERKPGRI